MIAPSSVQGASAGTDEIGDCVLSWNFYKRLIIELCSVLEKESDLIEGMSRDVTRQGGCSHPCTIHTLYYVIHPL